MPNSGYGSTESEATKPLPSGCELHLTFRMYSSNSSTHGMYAYIENADSGVRTTFVSEQFTGTDKTVTIQHDMSGYTGIPVKVSVGCQHNGTGTSNFQIQLCTITNS